MVRLLRKEEPRVNLKGYRDGTTTDDLGVVAYGVNPITVTIGATRKKGGMYNAPEKEKTSVETAAEKVQRAFVYAFTSSFPNTEEKAKIEQGKPINFTLRFKGYKHADADNEARDTVLNNAYLTGIQHGIGAIFRNLNRMYTGETRKTITEEEIILTEQEWFENVFLKANGTEERHYRVVEKDDPFYKWACREAKKKPDGKPISLQRTFIIPTKEGMQEAYDRAIAEKRATQAQEQERQRDEENPNEERIDSWGREDIRAAQRMAAR